jgi:hypothetical protein
LAKKAKLYIPFKTFKNNLPATAFGFKCPLKERGDAEGGI